VKYWGVLSNFTHAYTFIATRRDIPEVLGHLGTLLETMTWDYIPEGTSQDFTGNYI